MRRASLQLFACALLLCGGAHLASAQTRDVRLISARAGGVNFVTGTVTVKRADADEPATLTTKDDLRAGDVVATGYDGRVEVLLNPGSYLRLAENSAFELVDNSYENLRLKLTRGAAVAEVIGFDDGQPVVSIATQQTQIVVMKSGIYHVKVLAPGTTELAVQKGEARVGLSATRVKGGHKASIDGSDALTLAKLSKQERDALDVWSRERAEFLAKANARMTGNPTLVSALRNWHTTYKFSNGLWGYDEFTGGWSFIPVNRWSLSCPYGYAYNNRLFIALPDRAACPGCSQETVNVRRGGTLDGDYKRSGSDRFPTTQQTTQQQAQPMPQAQPTFTPSERPVESDRGGRAMPTDNMRPPV